MKNLALEIEYLSDLSKMVKAYEEIAAVRMQNIKKGVLGNREYTKELYKILQIVKDSYKEESEKYKFTFYGKKNGKTASVLMSANTGLYGDIVQRVFYLFLAGLKETPSEPVIIGRLGRALYESGSKKEKYVYFEIPDTELILDDVKKVADFLSSYETVIVYHGLFKNIIMQEAVASNLAGDPQFEEEKAPTRKLLFEPYLPEILSFFDSEIFSGFLLHTLLESQLAKFSARMAALEQATENIRKERLMIKRDNNLYRKRLLDKKQLEGLSGRILWESQN